MLFLHGRIGMAGPIVLVSQLNLNPHPAVCWSGCWEGNRWPSACDAEGREQGSEGEETTELLRGRCLHCRGWRGGA